jgi:hypothetical protein
MNNTFLKLFNTSGTEKHQEKIKIQEQSHANNRPKGNLKKE